MQKVGLKEAVGSLIAHLLPDLMNMAKIQLTSF